MKIEEFNKRVARLKQAVVDYTIAHSDLSDSGVAYELYEVLKNMENWTIEKNQLEFNEELFKEDY